MRRSGFLTLFTASLSILSLASCNKVPQTPQTPQSPNRQRVTGLGQTGWLANAEFELLGSGESQVNWRSDFQEEVVPIVVNIDEKGGARISHMTTALPASELKKWLANVAETFGSPDPVILKPKLETPLGSLEEVARVVFDTGTWKVYVVGGEPAKLASSVRLHGRFVPLTLHDEAESK